MTNKTLTIIFSAVYKSEPLAIQPVRDFRVSVRGVTESKYEINIGPRYRPQIIADFNSVSPNLIGNSFWDFYSPEATQFAIFMYAFLISKGRKNEISQYFPLTAFDDDTEVGDLYLTPTRADGGKFFIEKSGATLFWMKIPYGYSAGVSNDFTKLSTEWARIEQGTALPKNSPRKYDAGGNLTYTLYLPILSIEPIDGRMDIQYYDCGSIRYFSDNYKVEQGGKSSDLPFDYSRVSGYYRT